MEEQMSKPVKVLYIMGAGRSGTTILDMLLGQLDGFVSTGELFKIYGSNATCSCGEQIHANCPHWHEILCNAFGEDYHTVLLEMTKASPVKKRFKYLDRIIQFNASNKMKDELKQYLSQLNKLYSHIGTTLDANVIVDSSKSPPYGYLLSLLPYVELYIIHLVRDPRGVIYSWQKGNYDSSKKRDLKNSFFYSIYLWARSNLVTQFIISKTATKHLRIHYEDFTRNPEGYLKLIQDFVGETESSSPFIDSNTFHCLPIHTVDGNPVRFSNSPEIIIKEDTRWKEGLSVFRRYTTYWATLPLRTYYNLSKVGSRSTQDVE